MNSTIKEGINWVGYLDWRVRDFHGYRTERGSTYNAYLVQDEKIALIDAVKAQHAGKLLEHINLYCKPENIDYVVCNHAEPDHSSGLPEVMRACPQAVLVCNKKCQDALGMHYDTSSWKFQIVSEGDTISLGNRTLTFIMTPMVHWPESMFTYIPEDKVLFSMDAFGQHYASAHRFDDEEPLNVIMEEAKTYFANIVMLYGKKIAQTLEKAATLDIEMIAPSHGIVWRSHLNEIINAYKDWTKCKAKKKVLIMYTSMWHSTEKMATAMTEGALEHEVEVQLVDINTSNRTKLATEILDSATIAVGSPTLNMTIMPEMAALLTYLKGLKPANKAGFAFGSHGWAPKGATEVETYLKAMSVEILQKPLTCKFVPTPEILEQCREAGRMLAKLAIERTSE